MDRAEDGSIQDAEFFSNGRMPWLVHAPILPAEEVPQAPATFAFDADGSSWPSDDAQLSSADYGQYLLRHHPAYARPDQPIPYDYYGGSLSQRLPPAPEAPGEEHFPEQPQVSYDRVTNSDFRSNVSSLDFSQPNLSPYASSRFTSTIPDDTAHLPAFAGSRSHEQFGTARKLPDTGGLGDPRILEGHAAFEADSSDTDDNTEDESEDEDDGEDENGDEDEDQEEIVTTEISPLKRKRGRPRKEGTHSNRKPKRGRGRIPGTQGGMKAALKPTPRFTELYNAAMDAFVDEKDYDKAQALVLEAIGINPEVFPAHSLLADIHFAKDQPAPAVDALMMGLHGHSNDIELWRTVADTILSNKHETNARKVQRAAYCFSAIIRKDRKDADAHFQRAQCYRQLQLWNKAFSDLEAIRVKDPHNSAILSATAAICRDVNNLDTAKQLYREHFQHFKEIGISQDQSFTWEDIGVYAGIIADTESLEKGIETFKQLGRWLSGRLHETYWDEYPNDDREFDQFADPRRLEVPQYVSSPSPEDLYGAALPLDLRGRLGILRLRQGSRDEAQGHFSWFDPSSRAEDAPVFEYSDIMWEIGKALFDVKEFHDALVFFEALKDAGCELDLVFWSAIAESAYLCEKNEDAIQYYQKVLELDHHGVAPRAQLSKLYRKMENRHEALIHGRQAVILAQHLMLHNSKRRYEKREERYVREDAERTLKEAYRMKLPNSNRKGKVPKELKYRTRRSRKFVLYVPEIEEEEDYPAPRRRRKMVRDGDDDDETDARPKRRGRPRTTQKKPPATYEDPLKHAQDVKQLYQTLMNHQEDMRGGDSTATNIWMECAATLADDFRSVKQFFPSERGKRFTGYGARHKEPKSKALTELDASNSPLDDPEPTDSGSPGIPTTYCTISFAAWLDILLEYALLLATVQPSSDSRKECYIVLNAALEASVFFAEPRSVLQIQIAYLSCALALNDEPTIFNTCLRWWMKEFAFCTDAYRLFMAINYVFDHDFRPGAKGKQGQLDRAHWKSSIQQKFMSRQTVSLDASLPDDYNRDGEEGVPPAFMRQREVPRGFDGGLARAAALTNTLTNTEVSPSPSATPAATENIKLLRPQEMDVVLLVLYAQILMGSSSYPSALSYLYRAYTLDRTNSVVLLSMAMCYIHQSFKRQVERRHGNILMGLSWLGEYEKARLAWAEITPIGGESDEERQRERSRLVKIVKQEVEFNKARCWQMFGIGDLAVRGYEKALAASGPKRTEPSRIADSDTAMADDDDDDDDGDDEDFSMEAAYSMQQIYALGGDQKKAMQITEKYLVVE